MNSTNDTTPSVTPAAEAKPSPFTVAADGSLRDPDGRRYVRIGTPKIPFGRRPLYRWEARGLSPVRARRFGKNACSTGCH